MGVGWGLVRGVLGLREKHAHGPPTVKLSFVEEKATVTVGTLPSSSGQRERTRKNVFMSQKNQ